MSKQPLGIVEQAQGLVDAARLLPVDEAARALEQSVAMLQAAQAELLVAAERFGELKDSGCATVRSYAATILRRGVNDSSLFAQTAHQLADFPQLAAAYRAGRVHLGNLRAIFKHRKACGLTVLQAHEDQLVLLAELTGPQEITEFCQRLADLNNPDRDEAKAKALGLRSVRIVRVGDLARLDAMLDPAVADQLKATLAAMTKAAARAERAAEKAAEQAHQQAGPGGQDPSDGAAGGGWPDPETGVFPRRTHGELAATRSRSCCAAAWPPPTPVVAARAGPVRLGRQRRCAAAPTPR